MGQSLALLATGKQGDCEECGSENGFTKVFNIVDPYRVCLCSEHWEEYDGTSMYELKTRLCRKNNFTFH